MPKQCGGARLCELAAGPVSVLLQTLVYDAHATASCGTKAVAEFNEGLSDAVAVSNSAYGNQTGEEGRSAGEHREDPGGGGRDAAGGVARCGVRGVMVVVRVSNVDGET